MVTRTPAQLPAHFDAHGRPRTKGSLKVYCTKGRDHKIHLEEEVAESKHWRRVVARAAQRHMIDTTGGLWDIQEAVEVRLVFFFQRQESVNGGPVPTHDTQWPTAITLGDADKLTRNVLDALTDSRMIRDDSLVTHLMVAKMWVPEDMAPGVQVLVMPAPDESDMPPWWVK